MLEARGISRFYPGVKALQDVSVVFREGEIHALSGENGAGKSTLLKILCGIEQPSEGQVYIDGEAVNLASFKDGIDHGISIVHQEIQVVPMTSIAENIMLDKLSKYKRHGIINWKKLNHDAQEYADRVGLNLSVTRQTLGLSAAQKQLCQIAKCLSSGAKYLLFDEPTSSLTRKEIDKLFELIRSFRDQGYACIIVTHKLDEVMELAERITVLRDGRCIGTRECAGIRQEDIVEMMIGRKTNLSWRGTLDVDMNVPALEVKHISNAYFNDFSLTLHKGEILGLYGMVGAGRTELCKSIIGEYPINSGEIRVHGQKAKIRSMSDALNHYGIGYVSENRKEEGLILSDTIRTNMNITVWPKLAKGPMHLVRPAREADITREIVDIFEIKTPSQMQIINNLSGGNQQKVSIGKWVAADCDILLIDEPTIGVDVGAKEYIHNIIWDLAKKGKSILLVSSEMPELVSLARRIVVFRDYRIVGEINDLNDAEHVRKPEDVYHEIGMYLQKS